MHHAFRIRQMIAGVATAILAVPAFAAALPDYMPPAGYYRVDIESHSPGSEQTDRRHRTDGATGTETVTTGQSTLQTQGTQPNNICLQSSQSATSLLPPGMCPYSRPEVRNGVATFRANCNGMKGTMTMRKVDARTWEIASSMALDDSEDTEQDLADMKAAMQERARSTDPETREGGLRELADFDQLAADTRASEAQQAGGPTFKLRYTRVGERCTATAKK